MMKIAIAGTNGLAQFIAYYLSQLTSHSFVFLTRTSNSPLRERDWQVLAVTYDNASALTYTLRGVDVVISTINGTPQLALIEAAATARVRHFIPSGFSGPEQCSPYNTIRTDWHDTIDRLDYHQTNSAMCYTIFTCGVFYEHFGQNGLSGLQISRIGDNHACIGEEGDLLVDIRSGKAEIPVVSDSNEVYICMTSARDTARYVVASLQASEDLECWPREFKFCTERYTMSELVNLCGRIRASILGAPIVPQRTTPAALNHRLTNAEQTLLPNPNSSRTLSIARALAVAESHPALSFPISEVNLAPEILMYARSAGGEPVPPERFEDWLCQNWSTPAAVTPSARASANTSGKTSGISSRSGSSQKSKRPTPQ